jgi:hypothetical protein
MRRSWKRAIDRASRRKSARFERSRSVRTTFPQLVDLAHAARTQAFDRAESGEDWKRAGVGRQSGRQSVGASAHIQRRRHGEVLLYERAQGRHKVWRVRRDLIDRRHRVV